MDTTNKDIDICKLIDFWYFTVWYNTQDVYNEAEKYRPQVKKTTP